MRREENRVEQLARRIGWLDRRRRPLAISCAVLSAPLAMAQVDGILGADWPRFHAVAMTLVAGFVLWIALEIVLIALMAVWETEHHRLLRERGLPRAQVRRRRARWL